MSILSCFQADFTPVKKRHVTWICVFIILLLVGVGLSSMPSDAVADGDDLSADEYCAYALKAKIHKEDVTTVCKLFKKATEVGGDSACNGRASVYLEENACRYINTSGIRPLIISLDQRNSSTSEVVDALCASAVKAKLSKDTSSMCDYYRRAIEEGGENACRGTAVEALQQYNCSTVEVNTNTEAKLSDQKPMNDMKDMSESDYCSLAVRAKIQKKHDDMCVYYKLAVDLGGDKACSGAALTTIKQEGCMEVIANTSPNKVTDKIGLDDYCALGIKARLQKDTDTMCEYYNKAVEIGGRGACGGNALTHLTEAKCLNVVVKDSPQKSTPPKKNEPLNTDILSVQDICALGVKAKIQKDTKAMCYYYSKAIEKGGNNACGGKAASEIAICK